MSEVRDAAFVARFLLKKATYPMNSASVSAICPVQAPTELAWARRHCLLLTGLTLVVAAWCLYLPSAWYGFVYFDDVRLLRDQPQLFGQATLSEDLRAIFQTSFPREEPLLLRDVSWAIDSRLFGFGNPFGYHVVNVLLHGLVVGLLFGLLHKTTQRYGVALAGAAAWLILAVHTEPVAWIMGRKDILSGIFMLLALLAQTQRLRSEGRAKWWFWYLSTFILFLCGLLSKVSVLSFPLVLLLHAIFLPYLRGERRTNSALPAFRNLAHEAVLIIPSLAASAITYVWYGRILTQMGIFDRGYTARGLEHLWNVLMLDPLVLWLYLKQIFLPSSLNVLYTWPAYHPAYPLWQIAGAITTTALVLAVGIWLLQKRKDLFFYYAAFFALMVPYMNLAYLGILVADRYVYFAALFPLLIGITLAAEALRGQRKMFRVAALTIAAVVAADNLFEKLSYQRVWRDAETLWQYHVALPRPSPDAFANLGAYYYSLASAHPGTTQADLAMRKMEVVVDAGLAQFWPDRQTQPPPEIWNILFLESIVQQVKGVPQEALTSLLLADQLRPRFDAINLNLARLFFTLAKSGTDAAQKETYARDARDRFAAYIQIVFRGRTPPAEVTQEMQTMEDNYRLLAPKSAGPGTNPVSPGSRN
jgi:hypothetical protein